LRIARRGLIGIGLDDPLSQRRLRRHDLKESDDMRPPARERGVPPPKERASPSLSENEEVTLRRVAFGQSEVRAMRADDLAQLRRLRLIEDGKDGRPQLTADGKKCFDGLPRPMTLSEMKGADDFLATMAKPVDRTRR
jgi:hypothetical protein